MTELDFDELDKAVNSLMGDVDTSKRNPGLDDPEDNVVTLTIQDKPVDASTPAMPAAAAPASGVVEAAAPTAPVAPLAVKRRGQFMDMVHPSSDMKSPFAPVNRQGTTLQPTTAIVTPEAPVTAPEPQPDTSNVPSLAMEMESTGTGTPPAATMPVEPEASVDKPVKNEWPDPIDMAQPAVSQEPEATTSSEDAETTNESDVSAPDFPADNQEESEQPGTDAQPVVDEVEPLSSPFIPDAKVEKRPLGMPVSEDPLPPPAEPTPEPEQSPDLPPLDTPPVILPPELNSDVMSLESSNTGVASPEVPTSAPAVAADASSSSAAVSIQQQYTEQPSTGDQTNTPIFDTSTHVQPLEAPKKKSVLKWILAVLFLLVVGVAAGVAYFYYTTQ
ncbi:hypothetical protein B7Z00_01200 [Candidatus Saccharibacteria bacterium 32-50-10]|nr:MAG: hypothetical protein B7Z00_01200 [Candidatus Saccharibacteria bacterium 32-50-10]